MTRKELKQTARDQLRGNWGWAILLSFVAGVIIYVVSDVFNYLAYHKDLIFDIYSYTTTNVYKSVHVQEQPMPFAGLINFLIALLSGIVLWGVAFTILHFRDKGEKLDIFKGMFSGFTEGRFERTFLTLLLTNIFTFLWSLLLFIPGIIKGYSYAMTPYILKDMFDAGHKMTATEAISASRKLMDGHKMDLFILDLSFLGWWLLGIITIGIGFLWITPYYRQTKANYYRDLAGKQFLTNK